MKYASRSSDNAAAHDEKVKRGVRVSMPVKVLKFDHQKLTVDVQPLVKGNIDGEYHSQPPVMAVPIACVCMGKYIIRPWYERGDTGLLIVGDGDMDMALQSGDEAEPNTNRNHAPEDGVFIGGLTTAVNLPKSLPQDSIVVSVAEEVYLSVSGKGIEILGDVRIKGNVYAEGEIRATEEVTAKDIELTTHKHTGVEPGGGTSGQPVP